MSERTILLVEDEQNIASLVSLYLGNEGFTVAHVADGGEALAAVERLEPALVVLDVMLPGIDGLEICRRLRARPAPVPIILLTARDGEVDRVLGLELGADDYVTKPFSPRELVARVKAVLRRAQPQPETEDRLELDGVTVEVERRTVVAGEQRVELTAREFDLLAFLMRNRGIVFSRDRLLERVWGYERAVDTRTVDSHVKSLRQKLGGAGSIIQTVRGVGYKADASDGR
ncbi:MAG TPA: response regulator transcription factor [Actinomycetota bacterium]